MSWEGVYLLRRGRAAIGAPEYRPDSAWLRHDPAIIGELIAWSESRPGEREKDADAEEASASFSAGGIFFVKARPHTTMRFPKLGIATGW
jgi:hypothetical protein